MPTAANIFKPGALICMMCVTEVRERGQWSVGAATRLLGCVAVHPPAAAVGQGAAPPGARQVRIRLIVGGHSAALCGAMLLVAQQQRTYKRVTDQHMLGGSMATQKVVLHAGVREDFQASRSILIPLRC